MGYTGRVRNVTREPARFGARAGALASVVAGLSALAGCQDPLPAVPPPHPKHDLLIEGGVARYNGKSLGPGVPLDDWVAILGPPDRTQGHTYWDALGLVASEEKGTVIGLTVLIQVEPWMVDLRQVSITPATQAFPGRALLDGAPLVKGTRVDLIERQTKLSCNEDSVHGVGFRNDSLLGHSSSYSCYTKKPARFYYLRDHSEDLGTRWFFPGPFVHSVLWFRLFCDNEKPCP